MTFEASPSPRHDRTTQRLTVSDADARSAELRAANINPRTGLATDYLNHFNQAVMLLDMIPDMPECAEDFLQWQPRPTPSISLPPISRRAIWRSPPMKPRTPAPAPSSIISRAP